MKKLAILSFALFWACSLIAQPPPLTVPNAGGNKKAAVSEYIGLCEVKIAYNRPGVKGREGKIYGTSIAHYGFQDLQFGTSKASPWRVGANECTTISFSTDIKIEGQPLPAGKYGLFMALGEAETTVIFSKSHTDWGSFYYDSANDALRVVVKNQNLTNSEEWLSFNFINQKDNVAEVAMTWEKRRIAFKVEIDALKTQFESMAAELKSPKGFGWQAYVQAANFCAQNNYELEKGLYWANEAITTPFFGEKNFQTLSTKANILNKLGKKTEADAMMSEAMPLANTVELHGYARQLLAEKRKEEAFKVFKMNYDKTPNVFTTNVGLARGYSALGDYKKALEFAKMALPLAPNALNKDSVSKMIEKLEAGKDVN